MNQEPNSESLSATIIQLKQLNEQLQLQVAAHQRAEVEVRFLHGIAQAIDKSRDFHSALTIALEKICQFTGWQFGEVWIPSPEARVLTYSPAWYGEDRSLEQFRRNSEAFTFAPEVGLPGRVWASKSPEWMQIDREPETIFLRKSLAVAIGFTTGLGVPIIDSSDRVLAVLVFFMSAPQEENTHLIKLVSTIAVQLGTFLQRQQAEAALRQSNIILRSIIDSSSDFIYVKDLQGRYVTLNRATAEWFGGTIEEIVGKDDTQLFSIETAHEIMQVDRSVMLTGESSTSEEIVPGQGTLWTMLTTKSPWRDTQGNIIGVVCVSRNISDRTIAEIALRESKQRYATLAQAAPVGIFHTDAKGQCLYVNERWSEMTGLSATQALGTGWTQAIHPDDRDWILAEWNHATQQELMFCSEYRYLRPDGVITWVFGQATAEKNADGEVLSFVGTITDISERILATAALRESEALYCNLFAQTIEGIFFIDPQTKRILETNLAFANFLCYTPTQLIELSLYDVVALDPQIIDDNTQNCLKEKILSLGETPYRRSDGSIVYAEVNVSTIIYNGQEVACIIAHNVTERKQVEEALRQSQAWLQAILDNSTALIYIKNLEGEYLLVNVWFSLLFYSNRTGIKGKTDYDIFLPEIAATIRENDRKVLAARSPMDWEELLPHEDDGLHTYLSIKFPLYNESGEPYAICGISTDITERKRAEDALRSSMATNRALLNAIPDLMFRINRSGIFVNFKAAKGDRLHLPAYEFLGKHLTEVFPSEIAASVGSCIERALVTNEVQIFECQLIVNQEFRDYELRLAVSAENEVMAIVRDITDRKRTEAEIRLALEKEKELGELKSRFVTMASHEFRTPLATILSSSELLEHYSHKWSEDRKISHLQRIQTSVKHMTQLLNDVLLIGKAEAGKLDFKPMLIDLEQFCREIGEEIQLTASDRQIIFHYQASERTTGMMDEKLLRHIFINLLSNAIKYSPADSPINFDLIGEADKAIFRVQDRGIGIPLAEQDEVFSSFYRASNVGTISGTGLGLAIVKKSVDLHGGKIAVESAVDLGTIFTVVLPLNKQV